MRPQHIAVGPVSRTLSSREAATARVDLHRERHSIQATDRQSFCYRFAAQTGAAHLSLGDSYAGCQC